MPQRKEYITKQINKLNLTCKYFDAITPSDLSTNEYNQLSNINNPKSDIFEKYTRLPVLLSFIMCFMDAIENKYETIVIFEDDIQLNVNKTILNESIQEFLNKDCYLFVNPTVKTSTDTGTAQGEFCYQKPTTKSMYQMY